jgi:hypothetical protein
VPVGWRIEQARGSVRATLTNNRASETTLAGRDCPDMPPVSGFDRQPCLGQFLGSSDRGTGRNRAVEARIRSLVSRRRSADQRGPAKSTRAPRACSTQCTIIPTFRSWSNQNGAPNDSRIAVMTTPNQFARLP